MSLIKCVFVFIFAGFILSGCGETYFERMAKEHDVSEDEYIACYREFDSDASSVLNYLLERRMPFPLSLFSDDCYDFINDSRLFGAGYQDVIYAKEMGWDPESKEFLAYISEKEIAERLRIEKEEVERIEREVAARKLADEEMEYRHKKYNEEYVTLVLRMMKNENIESLENMARSYVDFFYYPKIQFLTKMGNEFDVKDYIDSKVKEVIEEAKSAQDISYDGDRFSVALGEYDFDRGAFSIHVVRQLKRVRLFVPCLHRGLRGVCLDGNRYDGRRIHSKIPTGVLPREISYDLLGMPSYLYAPEDEARKIRNAGPLHIYGDIHVSSYFSAGIIYLNAKNISLLDSSGNVIANMCSRGEECEDVFISN